MFRNHAPAFALLFAMMPVAANAQSCADLKCPSDQCAHQCFGSDCDDYCVRSLPEPKDAAEASKDLSIHITNARPALAAEIQKLIRDSQASPAIK